MVLPGPSTRLPVLHGLLVQGGGPLLLRAGPCLVGPAGPSLRGQERAARHDVNYLTWGLGMDFPRRHKVPQVQPEKVYAVRDKDLLDGLQASTTCQLSRNQATQKPQSEDMLLGQQSQRHPRQQGRPGQTLRP